MAILAESGEPGVPDPREGCALRRVWAPTMKIAILAESGEPGVPDPREGCALSRQGCNPYRKTVKKS